MESPIKELKHAIEITIFFFVENKAYVWKMIL